MIGDHELFSPRRKRDKQAWTPVCTAKGRPKGEAQDVPSEPREADRRSAGEAERNQNKVAQRYKIFAARTPLLQAVMLDCVNGDFCATPQLGSGSNEKH